MRPEALPQNSNHQACALSRGTHVQSLPHLILQVIFIESDRNEFSGQKDKRTVSAESWYLKISLFQPAAWPNCLPRTNCWIMKCISGSQRGRPICSTGFSPRHISGCSFLSINYNGLSKQYTVYSSCNSLSALSRITSRTNTFCKGFSPPLM